MYCSRRRLLLRALEFHVCVLSIKVPIRKKSGNLLNDLRISSKRCNQVRKNPVKCVALFIETRFYCLYSIDFFVKDEVEIRIVNFTKLQMTETGQCEFRYQGKFIQSLLIQNTFIHTATTCAQDKKRIKWSENLIKRLILVKDCQEEKIRFI